MLCLLPKQLSSARDKSVPIMNNILEAHTRNSKQTQAGYCPPNTGRILYLPMKKREERLREENGRQHLALIC